MQGLENSDAMANTNDLVLYVLAHESQSVLGKLVDYHESGCFLPHAAALGTPMQPHTAPR